MTDPKNHIRIVGLLGGVASGKSTVAQEFARLGAAVLDADRMAHEQLNQRETLEEIRQHFGEQIFDADRSLNRKKLASIVFQNDGLRKKLERIIHPKVKQRIEQELQRLREEGKVPMVLLDVPLLVEAGLVRSCDFTVFVDSPKAQRIERATARRGWSEQELELREKAQGDLDGKKNQAQFLVNNAGSVQELRSQIQEVFQKIVSQN